MDMIVPVILAIAVWIGIGFFIREVWIGDHRIEPSKLERELNKVYRKDEHESIDGT